VSVKDLTSQIAFDGAAHPEEGRLSEVSGRHRTAIIRVGFSRPVSLALEQGLLARESSVFDYGYGLGDAGKERETLPDRHLPGADAGSAMRRSDCSWRSRLAAWRTSTRTFVHIPL
jgi:hypothetical protein